MQWVAAGKSDDEIADILTLSAPTVTWHVENAKRKLDAFKAHLCRGPSYPLR